jgi:hypothetical protein
LENRWDGERTAQGLRPRRLGMSTTQQGGNCTFSWHFGTWSQEQLQEEDRPSWGTLHRKKFISTDLTQTFALRRKLISVCRTLQSVI